MTSRMNDLGQPVGAAMPGWAGAPRPPRAVMQGRFCRIEPVDVDRHGHDLFEAFSLDREGGNWTYLSYDRTATEAPFIAWMQRSCLGDDPLYHAVIDPATNKAVGLASFLRIDPANGVIEVGNIHFSPLMQRKPAATEAMYLMMRRVFAELGYRRYEWKCDSLNAPSRAAAARLGFSYDGLFPQALVYKGRNRDTTWFSIMDKEWPAIAAAFEQWLALENFRAGGRQRQSLAAFMPSPRPATASRPCAASL